MKKIRTSKEHEAALKELKSLWDKAKPGTPDGDRFEELAKLIEDYEKKHFKI